MGWTKCFTAMPNYLGCALRSGQLGNNAVGLNKFIIYIFWHKEKRKEKVQFFKKEVFS